MSDESLIKSFDGGLTEKAKTVIKVNVKKGNVYFKEAVPEENYKFKLSFTPAKRNISSLKNVASKKMTVKWGKLTGASGYQIQYSKAKNFSSKKTVTIKGDATVSKTVTKLTKGKTYYVRVRTYKNINGKAVYSGWSTVKSIKIKK